MNRIGNDRVSMLAAFAFFLLAGNIPAFAQQIPPQMNPTPGCTSTPEQMEATKKVALDFAFLTGEAKVALADPSYIQHQPVQHKRAQAGRNQRLRDNQEDLSCPGRRAARSRGRRRRSWRRRSSAAGGKSRRNCSGAVRHRRGDS